MIIRAGGDQLEDLVLVTSETTPSDLALAATMLLRSRQSKVKVTSGEIRAYVQPTSKRNVPGAEYCERLLSRLKVAPSQSVRGIGVVPTVEMDIRVKKEKKA
jgi:hypothetical protein